ncbi:MAG: GTP-binding protein [Spirulina sp. SIO3F2]|nr:GTP-binding protein [Spirulina sp. SIO3F2]
MKTSASTSSELTLKLGMPVTIITGFLGSGKTTLLNHILNNNKDLKVAVLVNEFGDINIDSQLLVSVDQDMVELSNGCICCTINEDLVDAVYRVLERGEKVDYMVIETTGLADPLPIILTFLGTALRDLTRLDSIITMVDAETFTPEHFDSEAALQQITYADVTILNKTDLAASEQVKQLESYIGTLKTGARILHSQQGQVPLPLILDVGYNNPEAYADLVQEEIELTQHDHEHGHHHHHEHDHHHHHDHEHHHHHSSHLENDGFVSVAFESDRPFSVQKFEHLLQEKLPKSVFRAKGILWFQESNLRNIFQLSGPRFDIKGEEWHTPPRSQLIFIGRHLDVDALRQDLTDCLV